MGRFINTASFLILILLISSCSGSSVTPTQPDIVPTADAINISHGPQLWGFWDVEWNPDANAFETTPLRSAMFSCNVIKFINMSSSNLVFDINSIVHDTDWTDFDLDVGITHPFPGLEKFTGFDVMGVFMGEGSEIYYGMDDLLIAGSGNQLLLNPDGYTRRFNATEFGDAGLILPLQGYIPGAKGTPGYYPTAELNPYKYYADGLDADADEFAFLESNPDNRGCFRPGNVNYRNFKVRLPVNFLKFQYAVLANWEPNKNHPDPPDSLDDFPTEANSQEAVAIKVVDSSDAWYVNETTYGGDISLDITPWDWSASYSGVMSEYYIELHTETGFSVVVSMTPTVIAEHHYTFHVDISEGEWIVAGTVPIWIKIIYPDYDYTSPVGVPNDATLPLTAYFTTEVTVLDHDPGIYADNFVYGIGDCNFFQQADEPGNAKLFTNMLNLPLNGPYALNKKVLYYEGRSDNTWYHFEAFGSLVESLGYEWELVLHEPSTPVALLDTTGVKMLIVATYLTNASIEPFTPGEIQAIKDLLDGGGVCVIMFENANAYNGPYDTHLIDQILPALDVDFSCPVLSVWNGPYTDFTPDPILEGVSSINGGDSGEFMVFDEGVSLVRGKSGDYVFTTICKSPWYG